MQHNNHRSMEHETLQDTIACTRAVPTVVEERRLQEGDRMMDFCTEIPYDEIDENIRHIVRFMNTQWGIETLSSCGGHDDKEDSKKDRFFIEFGAKPKAAVRLTRLLYEAAETNCAMITIELAYIPDVHGFFYIFYGDAKEWDWMKMIREIK